MSIPPPDKPVKSEILKLLVYCNEISTRYLLKVSLDPERYMLDFARNQVEFMDTMNRNAHNIYIIDASDGDGSVGKKLFDELMEQRSNRLRRVVMIVEKPMPPEANQVVSFGPLCFIEYYFSRRRLVGTLVQAMEMKDTGTRVKIDPKFFDITVFSKNKPG